MNNLKIAVGTNAKQLRLYDRNDKEIPEPDTNIQRELLMGMYTSDEVCKWADEHIKWQWIQSPTLAKLMRPVVLYYQKYDEAPKTESNIKALYFGALQKNSIDKDELAEFENDILPGLSEEFEKKESFNVKRLLNDAQRYLNDRALECWQDEISEARERGDDEALDKLKQNPPRTFSNADGLTLRDIEDYSGMEKPQALFTPWLRSGEYTLIYGGKSVGKSLFAIQLAYSLASENFDDSVLEINPPKGRTWQVKNPCRSMYVSGEMSQEVMDRFKTFKHFGNYAEGMRPVIIDAGQETRKKGEIFTLNKRKHQQEIIRTLEKHQEIKLLILDNVQTLFGLEDNNQSSEWSNLINPFLQELEALGVAVLVIDHTGKDQSRGQMGTEAKLTFASNVFALEKHPDQWKEKDKAYFKITPVHQRYPESVFKPFYIRYERYDMGADGKGSRIYETTFEVMDAGAGSTGSDEMERNIVDLLLGFHSGDSQKEIAEDLGVTEGTVTNWKKKAVQKGYLNGKTLTEAGKKYLKEMGGDDRLGSSLL